ncbi:hypothetical protein Sango_0183700 [Sesamum angolense]|uniref:Uncharacterized protein n=1 Tax=Sesamum angolense TaxID=2727404 RepID=A0AAE2C6P5_9LAMI|nr:hypothetical protein Sango_0183700 [Sesamum angolense]
MGGGGSDSCLPFPEFEIITEGVSNSGVPSWEIDYCHSVRVPWRKVLASKKYIYCHPSVLNWDDSAGKEALQNAKERYWALINGLSCDNPLPDPDVYIDEIDWNPYMDPDLMVNLDLQVFDPDNAQKIDKLEAIDEEAACAEVENDENPSACDNPWEKNHVQGAGSLKDIVQGWVDNGWRNGNDSSGWYHGIDNTRSAAVVDYGCGNSCNYIRQTGGAVRQKGLGHNENNSWVGVMGTPMLKDQGTQIIVDITMEIIILWVQKREVGGTRGMNLGFSKTTGTNLGVGGIPDTKIMSQSIGIHKDLSRVGGPFVVLAGRGKVLCSTHQNTRVPDIMEIVTSCKRVKGKDFVRRTVLFLRFLSRLKYLVENVKFPFPDLANGICMRIFGRFMGHGLSEDRTTKSYRNLQLK